MSAYVMAQLSIHDRERYGLYEQRFLPTLAPFAGRLLAADDAPAVMEGAWTRDRVVLIAFPDRAAAEAWAASPAYREIAADRLAASEALVLLAEGFGAS